MTIDPSTINTDSATCLETIDGNGTATNQSSYLSDTINLTGNIDLESGSTLYPWIPLGTSSSAAFIGTFNGNGHVVSGYTIGTSSNNYSGNDVGFIGDLGPHGVVKNLGVSGTIYATNGNCVGGIVGDNHTGIVETSYNTGGISGSSHVGGVVGYNFKGTVETSYNTGRVSGSNSVGGIAGNNNCGTVEYSYNTGGISGSGFNVGGVVGYNSDIVESSYNTGSVSASSHVGGVVGVNCGKVEYSYNTGSFSGGSDVGGVVGDNSGTVETSYNTGSVSNGNYVGGVVGDNDGTVTGTYYNSSIFSGSGIGFGSGSATGLSEGTGSGDLGNSASYSGWSFASNWTGNEFGKLGTWIIGTVYPNGETSGVSAPILVPDLATATVKGSGSSVYNGSTVTNAYTTTYTMGGTRLSPNVTVTTSVGPNVGTYTNTPTYSISVPTTQTSVDSVSAVSGTWSITKADLTLSGSGVYNGTTTLAGSDLTATGVDDQTFSIEGTGFGDLSTANVQTDAPLANVTNLTLGNSKNGGLASNYNPLSASGSSVTITPATLTVTANKATMTYGGSLPALSGTVTGFVDGQTLSKDAMSLSWSTSATSTSPAGTYGIMGSVMLTVLVGGSLPSSPYWDEYTVVQAPGNATALTITAANSTSGLSGSSGSGSSSSGPGTPGGVTSTHFPPVAQTANVSVSASGNSSSDNLSDTANSSSSDDSITLSSSSGSSLSVVSTGGGETTGDAILSTQELKQ